MKNLIDLYNFIFNYEVNTSFLAFIRVLTCGFVTAFYAFNLRDLLSFSHPHKIYPGKQYLKFCKGWPQISLFNLFPHSLLARNLIISCFFISGIFSTLGFLTNISIFIFIICFFSLQSRLWLIFVTGGDAVGKILLLSLLLVDCGAKYSIDNFLGIASNLDVVNGLPIRLVQFYICYGYLASTFFKLKDPNWATGESIRNVLFSPFWSRNEITFFLEPIFNNLNISKMISLSVLFYELFAFPLFYFPETRPFAIAFGLLFHALIGLFMRIGFFGPIMFVSLFYFTNQFFN